MMRTANLTILIGLLLAACGDDAASTPDAAPQPDAAPPDPTAAVYDPTHIVEVAITMAPADWDALRTQANNPYDLLGGDCQAGPKTTVWTFKHASVTVDGQTFPDVGVRKKGFLGSASATKPSLKINFDEYVAGTEFATLDKLTLNNNGQDPSQIRTCLAYQVFRDAGVPAPRCNFAHVTVNGTDLGIYSNVESVGKPMLRRYFTDDQGNLYEGQISDARTGYLATYEKKTNELDPDRSDLAAMAAALEVPDAELEATLAGVVDLDAFFTFWAAELLVGHWDGFTNNLNNHFLYHDPTSGQFHLIPWGPDYSFHATDLFMPEDRPASISANELMANRLYALPAMRTRYLTTLNGLLATAWDETALLAEIDRMEALITPFADPLDGRFAASLDAVREYVMTRRAAIETETAGGPADWTYPLPEATCLANTGTITLTFATTWNTIAAMDPFASGTATVNAMAPGVLEGMSTIGGAAAGDEEPGGLGYRHTIMAFGVFPDSRLHLVYMLIPPSAFVPGATLPIDWQSAFAVVGVVDTMTSTFTQEGFLNLGMLHLDEASTVDGEPVSGSITADFLSPVPAP